jgi:hypothetical protein
VFLSSSLNDYYVVETWHGGTLPCAGGPAVDLPWMSSTVTDLFI